MRQALAAQGPADMGQADIGLIHADVLADNVLDDGAALTLIDFDDCGIGYRGYDLGTALVSHAGSPDHAALAAALVEGYAARRGAPRDRLAAELPLFVALRAMASCGWAASRTPEGDPRRRAYAERALRLAEAWAAGEGAAAPQSQNGSGAPLARIVPSG
jgi:Ser/Thr protein kinase RdoA (MazF antagonist)